VVEKPWELIPAFWHLQNTTWFNSIKRYFMGSKHPGDKFVSFCQTQKAT
jgi:hypothetical protein